MSAVLVILLITVLGGMTFALASGVVSHLEAEEVAAKAAPAASTDDRCPTCGAQQRHLSVNELLLRLEQRIRTETVAVAQFIDEPSLESLHAQRAIESVWISAEPRAENN